VIPFLKLAVDEPVKWDGDALVLTDNGGVTFRLEGRGIAALKPKAEAPPPPEVARWEQEGGAPPPGDTP
jgi:hypothetical protein